MPRKQLSLNGFGSASEPCSYPSRDRRQLQSASEEGVGIDGIDTSGDTILWLFPNPDGCKCGQQAVQVDHVATNQGIDAYGISDGSPEELREMADRLGLGITLVSDPHGDVARQLDEPVEDGYPRVMYYYRDGEMMERVEGMTDVDRLESVLQSPCPGPTDAWTLNQPDSPLFNEAINHPGVYVITGSRGSGKSSLALRIGEALSDDLPVRPATVGIPEAAREHFPSNWIHVEEPGDAPGNSVIVIDEAYMTYSARESMTDTNKAIQKAVNASRHCNQTYLFVTQNASHLDKTAASEADALLMKEPGTFHMEFERKQFRDLSERAKSAFDQLPESNDPREYVYVYADDYQGMVQNREAEFFSDEISRSYSSTCGTT